MARIRMTTAQALVRFLNQQYLEVDGVQHPYVRGVMAIFGHGNVLGLGQALLEQPGHLVVHQARNEQGMGHAAIGFAKQKRRRQIYACTSSVGPGAANMVTAAATATANRIPVLFLPGDVYATRQPDPVLQQLEHFHDLGISTNDAFRSVSKYWDRINRPEQLMTALIHGFRVLTSPSDTGAVTIALPQDVQGEAWDFPEEFFAKRVHYFDRRRPSSVTLQQGVDLISRKSRPLLICGGGVPYSDAAAAFLRLAEEFQIPFGETQAGKGVIAWDHPLNLGGIGTTGTLAANTLARTADVVIGVGTRYTDFTTASKSLFQDPNVEFVNINIAEFDAVKLDGVSLVADARAGVEALAEGLRGRQWSGLRSESATLAKQGWVRELARLDEVRYFGKRFRPEVKCPSNQLLPEYGTLHGSWLTQTRVLGLLNQLLAGDAIVVGSSGSLPGDLQRMWRPSAPGSYHVEYGFSTMGYEVNAALGVKLACPDREVYAMVGDGSYLMSHSELPTSLQEGAKINVLLFDNMSFGCINNLQMSHGMASFGTEFRSRNAATGRLDGRLIPTDFAKSAEAYGCKSYRVTTEEELILAVKDSQTQTRSTLIDIKVLPKTMTDGYLAWWRTGDAQIAKDPKLVRLAKQNAKVLKRARQY